MSSAIPERCCLSENYMPSPKVCSLGGSHRSGRAQLNWSRGRRDTTGRNETEKPRGEVPKEVGAPASGIHSRTAQKP
jgi:hypothetical protein